MNGSASELSRHATKKDEEKTKLANKQFQSNKDKIFFIFQA